MTAMDGQGSELSIQEAPPAPIWCLACKGNLIIAGCGNGKIEVGKPDILSSHTFISQTHVKVFDHSLKSIWKVIFWVMNMMQISNSADLDQRAPTRSLWSEATLFVLDMKSKHNQTNIMTVTLRDFLDLKAAKMNTKVKIYLIFKMLLYMQQSCDNSRTDGDEGKAWITTGFELYELLWFEYEMTELRTSLEEATGFELSLHK